MPNNTYGYGRIDAGKAFTLLPNMLTLQNTAPSTVLPGEPITYTLTVTHKDPSLPTTNVVISDVIPAQTYFLRATGIYTKTGDILNWTFPQLGPNESQSVQLVVKSPYVETTIINDQFRAWSDQFIGPKGGSTTTNVAAVYSLTLAPNYKRFATAGSTITYTHNLTNTGNVADTYELNLISSMGWVKSFIPTPLTLLPGQSVPVQIVVKVPDNAVFGQEEISTLNVTSKAKSEVFASITDTTSVAYQTLMLPILVR